MKKNVENLKPSGKRFFLVKIKKGPMNEGRFFIAEVVSEAYKKKSILHSQLLIPDFS